MGDSMAPQTQTVLIVVLALGVIWLAVNAVHLALIAQRLQRIADKLEAGVIKMRDVDRARVYSEHLAERLRG